MDIGGTFTDVVLSHAGNLTSAKVPTTPQAPEEGFLQGMQQVMHAAGVEPAEVSGVIHGTTLATNALIERRGAKTALITTQGFRDSLEIGYESRFDQYDIFLDKPAPLVPRRLRFTLSERMSAKGQVLQPMDRDALEALIPELERAGVEAVVVGFLHSYANPAHEQEAGAMLAERLPGVAITLSSRVCPELREYERLSTAAANAYVQPLMSRYLNALRLRLDERGVSCPLMLVTSAGGITTLETATRFPVRLVESGPSGGAIMARNTAHRCQARSVLSFDMGGTTAKICLIDDYAPRAARQFEVARTARFMKGSGLPLRIPVTEMIEIGAGGGSLARLDELGRLTIGPQSAGADPGPVCYGRGGDKPTVTDADCALGRLDPERFAEGRIRLEPKRARQAIDTSVGKAMGLTAEKTALAICEMVDETMANAARVHAAEHGADLNGYTLIAFGGSGPLHAGRLAQKLNVARIIVPVNPSVGSAVGFLQAPAAYELVQSHYTRLSRFDAAAANRIFAKLWRQGREVVSAAAPEAKLCQRRGAFMRYSGQGHEIEVSVPDDELSAHSAKELRRRYEAHYLGAYGKILSGVDIEVLTWSLLVSTPEVDVSPAKRVNAQTEAPVASRRRVPDPQHGGHVSLPVYMRADLSPGMWLAGPAFIVEAQTTTVVPENWRLMVDSAHNLILELDNGVRP